MKHLIIYLDTTQGLDKYVFGALHCSIGFAQKQQKVSEKIDVSALFFAVALFFSQCYFLCLCKWDCLTNVCCVQTYVWAPTLIIITVATN